MKNHLVNGHPVASREHAATRQRFDDALVASRYARNKNHRPTAKNRGELRCIAEALASTPPGSRVLDLPTGAGRLLPMLLDRGYQVLAADTSEHMLRQARAHVVQAGGNDEWARSVEFARLDVMATGLPDASVDLVICNRLLHHYPSSEVRQRALAELARITRRTVIVSYFSNVALSAARFHLKNWLRRHVATDRIPIWPDAITADARTVGLTLKQVLPVRFGLSPQTYLVLERGPAIHQGATATG